MTQAKEKSGVRRVGRLELCYDPIASTSYSRVQGQDREKDDGSDRVADLSPVLKEIKGMTGTATWHGELIQRQASTYSTS